MDNLWGMIAKERGVELNEEFILVYMGSKYKHKITTYGLNILVGVEWRGSCSIDEFIRGEGEIEKIPFRPQKDDVYYTIMLNREIISSKWDDNSVDYTRLIAGVVFRTEKEARDYIPTWKERISNL